MAPPASKRTDNAMRAGGPASLRADRRESLPTRFMASHSTLLLSWKRSTRFSPHVHFVAPDVDASRERHGKEKGPTAVAWNRFVMIV
jgi:hypothetical protein